MGQASKGRNRRRASARTPVTAGSGASSAADSVSSLPQTADGDSAQQQTTESSSSQQQTADDDSAQQQTAESGSSQQRIAEKYRVLRPLGEGSSGTVYLCEHTGLEKQVAVKVLHRELADNADLVARFKREAQTAARLDHPNSVQVMDFGQDHTGTLYLAMEYVEGRDLAQLLEENAPLNDERIVHIMTSILSALSAAHALGIVHRDLKPENVLFRYGSDHQPGADVVKVCDFGVAQLSPIRITRNAGRASDTPSRRVTGDGMIVGTPWYMSPEQARAEELDARSDIYSAGVVLFQLLTRTLPFVSDDPMAVAVMQCTTPPPPPSGFGAVHPGLEAVCLKALSKTREARYQSALEMLTALQRAMTERPSSRSLARVSRAPGDKLALLPALAPTPQATEVATAAVPPLAQARRVRPAWLATGAALTCLTLAAIPQLNPSSRVKATTTSMSVTTTASERVVEPAQRASHAATSELATSVSPSSLDSLPGPTESLTEGQSEPGAGTTVALTSAKVPDTQPSSQVRPAKPQGSTVLTTTVAATPSSKPETSPSRQDVARKPTATATPTVQAAAARAVEPLAQDPQASTQEAAKPGATSKANPESPSDDEPTSEAELGSASPAPVAPVRPATQTVLAPPAAPQAQPYAAVTRVAIATDKLPSGVSRSSLRAAFNQAALVRCYSDLQQKSPSIKPPSATLSFGTNSSGHIVMAAASGEGVRSPLRECIEQVTRTGTIRSGEGGEVRASVTLQPE